MTPLLTLAASPATVTDGAPFPYPEKLSYRVEWRLVTAGSANLQFTRAPEKNWDLDLTLESAGLSEPFDEGAGHLQSPEQRKILRR